MAETTLSQTIARRLSEEIVRGQLAPGTRLDEQSLADRFRVSRSPVRDALRELAATRLVDYVPHRGFSVARIEHSDLDDIFEASSEIEALCARLCAMRAGTTDRKRIELIHEQGKAAVAAGDSTSYARLNEDFHRAVYAGARNKTLESTAVNLRQRLAPFRSRVFFDTANRIKSSLAEHDAIVNAILDADSDAAAEAMRQHAAHAAMNAMHYFATPPRPRGRRTPRTAG